MPQGLEVVGHLNLGVAHCSKGMIPIITALGAKWIKGRVTIQCDNEAVVAIINSS